MLGRFLSWLESWTQRRRAKSAPAPVLAEIAPTVHRHFSRHPESTFVTLPLPTGLARFERGDLPRLIAARQTKGIGERVLTSVMAGGTGYGWPGGWGQNRTVMAEHFRHWNYVAIDTIGKAVAGLVPNIAFVRPGQSVAEKARVARAYEARILQSPDSWGEYHDWLVGQGHRQLAGNLIRKMLPSGARGQKRNPLVWPAWSSPASDHLRQKRYLKSHHAIKPHEEVEPAGDDHPLCRLVARPNEWDVTFDLLYEWALFLALMGNSYLWLPPSRLARHLPCELWILPAHWVWPRLDRDAGGVLYYELRPYVGPGVLRIPPDEVVHFKFKSPQHKIDGFSPQMAFSEWIDVAESIDRSRYYSFKNGTFARGAIELPEGYDDPDEIELDRQYAKLFARIQGEVKYGAPLLLPAGAKWNSAHVPPAEMEYIQSAEQLRDWVLAGYRVPKEVAGIQDAGSEIAMYGPLQQFARNVLAPLLGYGGQVLTERVCKRWDDSLRWWWEDPTPDSPAELRANIQQAAALYGVSPNDARTLLLGMEPWPNEAADCPFVQPGVTPLPLNEPGNLDDLEEYLEPPGGAAGGEMPPGAGAEMPGEPSPGQGQEPVGDDLAQLSQEVFGQ